MAFFVGIGGFLLLQRRSVETTKEQYRVSVEKNLLSQKPERTTVHLYFSDPDERHLSAEERTISVVPNSVQEKGRAIIGALIEGPRTSLVRTVPQDVKLLAFHFTKEGIAYVDFDQSLREKHPQGTSAELLTVFSIVNSLALNIPEIQWVRILIEGGEVSTLAGHVEMRFPFQANLLMMK